MVFNAIKVHSHTNQELHQQLAFLEDYDQLIDWLLHGLNKIRIDLELLIYVEFLWERPFK